MVAHFLDKVTLLLSFLDSRENMVLIPSLISCKMQLPNAPGSQSVFPSPPRLASSPFEIPKTLPRTGPYSLPVGQLLLELDVIVLGKQFENILASLGAGMPFLVLRSS